MFEFAHAYGFTPDPTYPWSLFVAGVERAINRFDARAVHHLVQGVNRGVSTLFGSDFQSDLDMDELYRAAYPVTRDGPRIGLDQSETRKRLGQE